MCALEYFGFLLASLLRGSSPSKGKFNIVGSCAFNPILVAFHFHRGHEEHVILPSLLPQRVALLYALAL